MSNEIINTEFEVVPEELQEQEVSVIEQIVFGIDPALLVSEFLKDKEVSKDDSLNIELFIKGDISGWRFKNIPAPSLEELKALEPQVSSAQSQQVINAEALAFLNATDWMVIRAMEKGEELSLEFKAERQAARERIIK
jgi:hypothetical protein